MTNDAELAIRLTADADDAVRALNDVGDAADRMASDVDDATRRTDDAASRMDAVGESADNMASRSAQAAGGIGDLGGALSLVPGPLGAVGTGMEAVSPAIMGVTGASDLLNLAMTSSIVTQTKAKAAAIAHRTATIAQAAATRTMAVATRILNVAMRANPIGIAVTAALALAGLFVLLYKRSSTFRNIVNTVMRAVRGFIEKVIDVLKRVWEFFTDDLPAGARAMRDKVSDAWQWIRDKAGAAWTWVRDKVADVIGAIRDKVNSIRDTVASLGTRIRQKLGDAWDWVMDKIQPIVDAVESIVDAVRNIDLPDIPFVGRSAVAGPGALQAQADAYNNSGGDTVNITVPIEAGILTSEAQLGAQLVTVLDRYMRSIGREPVFGV